MYDNNYYSNQYRFIYYINLHNTSKIEKYCYIKDIDNENSYYLELKNKNENRYAKDLLKFIYEYNLHLKYPNMCIKYLPKDRVELFEDAPTLIKSRIISKDSKNSILVKMNINHHFNILDIPMIDIPFEKKRNECIWRGSTTGYGFENNIPYRPFSREILVKKYINHPIINVGITKLVQNAKNKENIYKKYMKSNLSIEEMLKYKYIISIEGNDVATNLKWIMYSNSIVFMPKPFIESWIMESHLIPYYHYIPIKNDFSDIEDQIKWCNDNPNKCKEISLNAKKYISMFLDEKNESILMSKILEYYLNNFHFI